MDSVFPDGFFPTFLIISFLLLIRGSVPLVTDEFPRECIFGGPLNTGKRMGVSVLVGECEHPVLFPSPPPASSLN